MGCKKHFSVCAGTVTECSRLPLGTWLLALYVTITARKGVSSVQLARESGITRKSAWFLQQRIGAACADHRNPVTGEVTAVFRLQPQQGRQDHGGTESSQQGISGQPGYVVP